MDLGAVGAHRGEQPFALPRVRKNPEAASGTNEHALHVSECLWSSVLGERAISSVSPLHSAVLSLHKPLVQASQRRENNSHAFTLL